MEALGIVDIMVIDTFLIAYTPMNHDYYYLVYSTSNLKKLGKFYQKGEVLTNSMRSYMINAMKLRME